MIVIVRGEKCSEVRSGSDMRREVIVTCMRERGEE